MKPSTHYVLFITLQGEPWAEGPYRWKSSAQDNIRRIIAMMPHPPAHAKICLEECEGRKSIKVIEEWQIQDGQWVLRTAVI
jgi:hypothetical protein